jgi:RimJ/RimL family protein N-acetyltransferase
MAMARIESSTHSTALGDIEIRTAEGTDGEAWLQLMRATARETEFLTREAHEILNTAEEFALRLTKALAAPHDLFLIAYAEAQPVAHATLIGSPLTRFAHEAVLGIAVRTPYWGHGVGGRLTRSLLDWADERKLVRVALEVAANNARAIGMYERLGFELEGTLRARRKNADVYVDNLAFARIRLPG